MSEYEKWGIRYLNRLFWHLTNATALWGLYEVKYQEVNWKDLGWALLVGAVLPTLRELFQEGIPIPPDPPKPDPKPALAETKP